jgi:hypothetical protein
VAGNGVCGASQKTLDVRRSPPSLSTKPLSFSVIFVISFLPAAGVAELADALDSKSSDRKIVWVRAPPPAFR